jgi:toxin ParE1/3/4
MTWKIVFRPEVEDDVAEAADWYENREPGLGTRFVSDVIAVWNSLAANPHLNSRRHRSKDIRWRYPDHFPYRVVYEVMEREHEVVILAVSHAARHDDSWQSRIQ